MNWFAKFIAVALLLLLSVSEAYLFLTFWPVIVPANYEKVGPIIQSLFTPIVAAFMEGLFGVISVIK